ncbi:MAG: DUF308 domain-containing protein [Rhizobiales bacterium]|nr:DUF308 domain-containing protein [Hyphomicrobiales bacterium]
MILPAEAATPARPASIGAAIDRISSNWGWFAAYGALLIALGALALVYVVSATVATVLVNGVLMAVAGVAEIAFGLRAKTWGRFILMIFAGVLYLAAGVLVWMNPLLASAAMTLMLGVALLIAGGVRFALAFQMPSDAPRAWVFLGAAATTLLGALVLAMWPGNSLVLLGTLLGVELILSGFGWISFASVLRRFAN